MIKYGVVDEKPSEEKKDSTPPKEEQPSTDSPKTSQDSTNGDSK